MAQTNRRRYLSVEICAGAGGQAVGLHNAGFQHHSLIEIDKDACRTLQANIDARPDEWAECEVRSEDLTQFDWKSLKLDPGELDLLAGGVPCPPFSAAGKQLGREDERDLFPTMLDLVRDLQPKAVMIENVRGLVDAKFAPYRAWIEAKLVKLGYTVHFWKVLEAKDFGVPQLRPRAILVAMKSVYGDCFEAPVPSSGSQVTVKDALEASMKKRYKALGGPDAEAALELWQSRAGKGVAPTLVGGSKKHGGADLGPTRAKRAWEELGVCGLGVANSPEEMKDAARDLLAKKGPKLTVSQAAIIQGFPEDWKFTGKKTAAYRQVGNAFPPPVAQAVGEQIYAAFDKLRAEGKLADSDFKIPQSED